MISITDWSTAYEIPEHLIMSSYELIRAISKNPFDINCTALVCIITVVQHTTMYCNPKSPIPFNAFRSLKMQPKCQAQWLAYGWYPPRIFPRNQMHGMLALQRSLSQSLLFSLIARTQFCLLWPEIAFLYLSPLWEFFVFYPLWIYIIQYFFNTYVFSTYFTSGARC